LDLTKTRVELFLIDLVVAIKTVEVSEGSSKSTDGLSTSGFDLGSNLIEDCTAKIGMELVSVRLHFELIA
jgi:hypothetical protein